MHFIAMQSCDYKLERMKQISKASKQNNSVQNNLDDSPLRIKRDKNGKRQ